MLYEKNINIIPEYAVKGLRNKNALLFDIKIENGGFIEVDGTQHFSPKFNTTEENFKKVIENDNRKNKYCKEKGINLLRIPYVYEGKEEHLRKILECFINDGIIFEEIKDFYSKIEFSDYCE